MLGSRATLKILFDEIQTCLKRQELFDSKRKTDVFSNSKGVDQSLFIDNLSEFT